MSSRKLTFTEASLVEALNGVLGLHDMSRELIAEQVFANAAPAPAPVEREAVEVVGYLIQWKRGNTTTTTTGLGPMRDEGLKRAHGESAFVVSNEPLMTVAQHDRIVASLMETKAKTVSAEKVARFDFEWCSRVNLLSRNTHAGGDYVMSEDFDRIVAAKDAEIARLQSDLEGERNAARDGNADYLELQAERDELRDQLAEQPEAVPDECPHLILFDDADVKPIMFAGSGARKGALAKWEQVSHQWNAHLFVRIAKNCRDDQYPCATVAAPAAPQQGVAMAIPRVSGIGRDVDHPRAVVLYLDREPNDDDLRAIQDRLREVARLNPSAQGGKP